MLTRLLALTALLAALAPPAAAQAHQKYALLVGVAANMTPENVLFGAPNDTAAMRSLLVGKYGVPAQNVRVLLDSDATRAKILAGWEWLIERAKPGDSVLFYYSGHGVLLEKPNSPESDGALCPYDALTRSQLVFGYEIGARIDRLKTDRVTVIVDACHSGASSRDILGGRKRSLPASAFGGTTPARRDGVAATFSGNVATRTHQERYIGAARNDQKAHEDPFLPFPLGISADEAEKQATMGAMTFYLVRELRADAANRLTYIEVVRRVRDALRQKYGDDAQEPQVSGPGVDTARFFADDDPPATNTGRAAVAEVVSVSGTTATIRALGGAALLPGSVLGGTGTKEWVERSGAPTPGADAKRPLLRVTATTGLIAAATVVRGPVLIGTTYVEIAHGQEDATLRVALTGAEAGRIRATVAALPFARIVETGTGADVSLDARNGTVTPYRGAVALPPVAASAIPGLLNRLQAGRLLADLVNPSSDALRVTLVGGGVAGFQSARIGDKTEYVVTAERDAYVTIIDVGADGAITGLADQPVRAGQPFPVPVDVTAPAGLDTVKVIATRVPLGITLPATAAEAKKQNADPAALARAIVARITGRLNQADRGRGAALGGGGAVVADDSWGSAELLLRIEER